MSIASDISDIKEVSDTLTGNKVARFAYTQQAYDDNDADGVQAYNVNNEQNIPVASASIMKVNDTVIDKGWRARASSITRMLMNHFLGRLSYNVNKLTDMFASLLTALNANLGVANGFATLNASGKVPDAQLNMGVANGIATLNASGKVPDAQLNMGVANGLATLNASGKVTLLDNVVNTGDSATPVSGGITKFTTGGAYTELAKKAPTNHTSSDRTYGEATTDLFGHVRKGRTISANSVVATSSVNLVNKAIHIAWNTSTSARNFSISNSDTTGKFAMVLTAPESGNVTASYYVVNNDTPVSISVPSKGMCIILSLDFYDGYIVE